MDRDKYLVRPFAETDYESASRLISMVNPEMPFTAEEHRHWDRAYAAPHLIDEKWVVEERRSRKVVGFGEVAHSPFSYDPQKFWVTSVVDPAYRGQGIGLALSSLLESEAAAHHATHLWVNIRNDDPRALEFARKQGFVELRRLWLSTLDVTEVKAPTSTERLAALEREKIRFTTLAEEGVQNPDVRRRVFDLVSEAARDVPRLGEYTPVSFKQFTADLDGPLIIPEGYFLAGYGEAYVAVSNLERDLSRTDSLRVGFTGTRAAYRGRGIASELKRRAIEYARAHSIRYLRTVNDSLNLSMWAINEKLGFRRTVEWVAEERRYPGPSAPSAP
jgi:GNAT superfamily N-acetyltransferase